MTQTNKQRTKIRFPEVTKSYVGRAGCMCGCIGEYSIPRHVPLSEANKEVGYKAYTEHNDRKVKLAVAKLNKLIDWDDPDDVKEHVEEGCAWYNVNGRTTVVYFKQQR